MSEKAPSALESLIPIPVVFCVAFWLFWSFLVVTILSKMYHPCFNIIDGDLIDGDFRFTDYFCFSVLSFKSSKTNLPD